MSTILQMNLQTIFLNENYCSLIQILLKFVSWDTVDIKSSVVQVMAWHHSVTRLHE